MRGYLAKRLHPSWLIAWVATSIIVGIGTSISIQRPLSAWWLVIASVCLFSVFRLRIRGMVLFAVLAGLIIGNWRGELEQVGLQQYKAFYGKTVNVQGTVSDDPSFGAGGDQRVILKDVSVNGIPMNGKIWTSSSNNRVIQRSDMVSLRGKLGAGFGNIAASMFHASLTGIVHPQPGDIGLQIRDWFADGVKTAIPEPEADLATGYLVGQRNNLPADLDTQLKVTGLTHAVVASGYNLTILVSLGRQLLLGVSKYLATLSAASLIVGFIAMSGLSPSMARAGLVASLSLAAWYYGRKIHPLVLLPFAAAITALFDPFYVWGDIGWYLSFTSFAGVIILAPLVRHALWKSNEQPGIVAQLITDTMSAQIATLPIMIFAFGHYSPYALLANLLVLPLVPVTMLLTFIAGLAAIFIPAIAHIVGLPATIILRYMTTVVAHIADFPGAYGDLSIGIGVVACSYLMVILVIVVLWRKTKHNFRAEPSISITT